MALIYQRSSGPQVRATLSGFFIVGSALSIFALLVTGRYGLEQFAIAIVLLPAVLIGICVSRRTAPILDTKGLRVVLLLISLVSGLAVLGRGLL